MSLAHTLKSITVGMPHLFLGGVPSIRAGEEQLSARRFGAVVPSLQLASPRFKPHGRIPSLYTADGQNISPPLRWSGVPTAAKSLALVVEDPDAPTPHPFLHWLLFNIDPHLTELPEGAFGYLEAKNSGLKVGYAGAAPPKGDLEHRYFFQLFALDRMLPLKHGAGRTAVLGAMQGHVLARGALVGTYAR